MNNTLFHLVLSDDVPLGLVFAPTPEDALAEYRANLGALGVDGFHLSEVVYNAIMREEEPLVATPVDVAVRDAIADRENPGWLLTVENDLNEWEDVFGVEAAKDFPEFARARATINAYEADDAILPWPPEVQS